ncbi:MAG: hypothetical protein JO353_12050, partial [Phycisphaerae bacterium]|nr:hypothetical protein [Phycisphaerae bacterium]
MLPTSTRLSFSVDNAMPADADGVVVFATDNRQIVGDGVMILTHDEVATAMRLL